MTAKTAEKPIKYPNPKRQDPPEPIFRGPDCALCDQEMHHDGDSFRCDPCGYSWSDGGGTWDEDLEPQCAAVLQPHKDADPEKFPRLIGITERCLLGAYHVLQDAPAKPKNWWDSRPVDPRQHRSEQETWDDGDPREVTPRLSDHRLEAMRDGIEQQAERARRDQHRRQAEAHQCWREANPEKAARMDAERAERERRWAEHRAGRPAAVVDVAGGVL